MNLAKPLNKVESAQAEFNYEVRVSHRSRRVYLRLTPLGKLEVVIPKGFNQKHIPDILCQRRDWIKRTQAKQQAIWARSPEQYCLQPQTINLQALGEHWQVEYVYQQRQRVKLRPDNKTQCLQLLLPSKLDNAEQKIAQSLQKWLSQYAKQTLIPWLDRMSEETGLRYSRACIRAQKTRWGSCSSRQVINLNRNLLFVPPELVRYLLIHELSHTRYMDHSRQFWFQVAQFEPNYQRFDQALDKVAQQLPLWLYV